MTLEDKVQDFRLHALQRAKKLGNVSAACRELGISRTVFYRWKKRLEEYGRDGLHPKRTAPQRGRPPELGPIDERRILAMALANPAWGPQTLSIHLARQGVEISPSTIYRALRRMDLNTASKRYLALERHSAEEAGLLTERTRRNLQKAARRHVEASEPGELVCIDTFYIGKLKGVGKLWQITACDAACSYGFAHIIPARKAEEAARFLREFLVPEYEKAGWKLRRVLTDRGSEFKGAFDKACKELGIRHTRTKPRHAWTNGFVERLQGTILHEHWRVVFRRRYFTRSGQVERSLQSFMRFYNHDRPHRGYRTKGRTPAEMFWGAAVYAETDSQEG